MKKNGLRSGEGGKWNVKPQPDEHISYYAINLSTKRGLGREGKKEGFKNHSPQPSYNIFYTFD